MKKKLYTFRFIITLIILTGFTQIAQSQDEYFREGFELSPSYADGGISTTNPVASAGPNNYYANAGTSKWWYLHNAYRTTGTPCPTYGTQHIRLLQNGADTPYLITPVLDFGVGTVHVSRSSNGSAPLNTRRISIFTSNDTAVGIPYNGGNWELAFRMPAGPNPCVDTGIVINRPNAKRVAFIVSQASNADIDSIWITSTSPIVPVKFTGINAAAVNGMTKVSWNIATELNTRSYIVEKSTDGVTFKNVAEVTATNAGTYSWIDHSANPGNVYYRVKSVDKDGKLGFSGVIKLSTALTKPGFVITPNVIPGRTMNLQLTNIVKGTVTIRVSNNMGQIVYSSSLINEGGSVSKSISLPGTLQAGTYRVQLVSGSSLMTQTAILQ